MKNKLKRALQFVMNPQRLICIVAAWFITNGWSYILLGFGTYFKIDWMMAVAGAYLAFLWLPISPEKIVTFAIALMLLRRFFPEDRNTLAVLKSLYEKAQSAVKNRKEEKHGAKQSRRKEKHNSSYKIEAQEN